MPRQGRGLEGNASRDRSCGERSVNHWKTLNDDDADAEPAYAAERLKRLIEITARVSNNSRAADANRRARPIAIARAGQPA